MYVWGSKNPCSWSGCLGWELLWCWTTTTLWRTYHSQPVRSPARWSPWSLVFCPESSSHCGADQERGATSAHQCLILGWWNSVWLSWRSAEGSEDCGRRQPCQGSESEQAEVTPLHSRRGRYLPQPSSWGDPHHQIWLLPLRFTSRPSPTSVVDCQEEGRED